MSEERRKGNLRVYLALAAGVGVGALEGALNQMCPNAISVDMLLKALIPAVPLQAAHYNSLQERMAIGVAVCGGSLVGQAAYGLYRAYS